MAEPLSVADRRLGSAEVKKQRLQPTHGCALRGSNKTSAGASDGHKQRMPALWITLCVSHAGWNLRALKSRR